MSEVEGTTMEFIARMLHQSSEAWVPWEQESEGVRTAYRRIAVKIIDTAEPVWRGRVEADPGAAAGWAAAVDHLEPILGQEMKRAAHADNPYTPQKESHHAR